MPESYKAPRYEDRPSSRIGLGDYARKYVLSLALPAIGFGAGLGLRKLLPKVKLLNDAYVFPFFTPKSVRAMVEAQSAATGHYVARNAESWGAKIGGAWGLYNLWRDRAKSQLGINDVQQQVLALKDVESPNDYLRRDNDHMRQELRLMGAPEAVIAGGVSREGSLAAAPRREPAAG